MAVVRCELTSTRDYAVVPEGIPWRPLKLRIWVGSRCLSIGLRSRSVQLTRFRPEGNTYRWLVRPKWQSR